MRWQRVFSIFLTGGLLATIGCGGVPPAENGGGSQPLQPDVVRAHITATVPIGGCPFEVEARLDFDIVSQLLLGQDGELDRIQSHLWGVTTYVNLSNDYQLFWSFNEERIVDVEEGTVAFMGIPGRLSTADGTVLGGDIGRVVFGPNREVIFEKGSHTTADLDLCGALAGP